ncbi:hypothetical protein CLOM_g15219 [Closterium sp. NIES-68]|nr:hypothetical protein CLOM_g15219 [Closterium sp. NIES-68]
MGRSTARLPEPPPAHRAPNNAAAAVNDGGAGAVAGAAAGATAGAAAGAAGGDGGVRGLKLRIRRALETGGVRGGKDSEKESKAGL